MDEGQLPFPHGDPFWDGGATSSRGPPFGVIPHRLSAGITASLPGMFAFFGDPGEGSQEKRLQKSSTGVKLALSTPFRSRFWLF